MEAEASRRGITLSEVEAEREELVLLSRKKQEAWVGARARDEPLLYYK